MPTCPLTHSRQCKVIKYGRFSRQIPGPRAQRYRCKTCNKTFCDRSGGASYRERKTHLRSPLLGALCSCMSQRRIAKFLGISKTTVQRKLLRLADQARREHLRDLAERRKVKAIVFDEMETFEHSKCKPLSIAVAVEDDARYLISAEVSQMPAKGLLAAISRKKYGKRKDRRREGLIEMTNKINLCRGENLELRSDECPRYLPFVILHIPNSGYFQFKGRRGCVVGQGELKRGGRDPLFFLNHTCAMIRCNLKRLSRRSWCTTKKPAVLQALLDIYVWFHNRMVKLRNNLPRMRVELLNNT